MTMARSGAGAVPLSRASSVSASSTPFFQSLELLLIVVLNDGASAVAAAITARKRGMLLGEFYGCVGSCLTLAVQERCSQRQLWRLVAVVLGSTFRNHLVAWRQL